MARFRRVYGSHPGHLLAVAFALAFAAYGFTRIYQELQAHWFLVGWFLGALAVNDFVFLPLYTALYRAVRRGAGADAGARRRVTVLNHLLVPAVISAFLFLAWIPLILRLGLFRFITTLSPDPYLYHWVYVTAGLFLGSGLVYVARALRRRRLPEAQVPGEAEEPGA